MIASSYNFKAWSSLSAATSLLPSSFSYLALSNYNTVIRIEVYIIERRGCVILFLDLLLFLLLFLLFLVVLLQILNLIRIVILIVDFVLVGIMEYFLIIIF